MLQLLSELKKIYRLFSTVLLRISHSACYSFCQSWRRFTDFFQRFCSESLIAKNSYREATELAATLSESPDFTQIQRLCRFMVSLHQHVVAVRTAEDLQFSDMLPSSAQSERGASDLRQLRKRPEWKPEHIDQIKGTQLVHLWFRLWIFWFKLFTEHAAGRWIRISVVIPISHPVRQLNSQNILSHVLQRVVGRSDQNVDLLFLWTERAPLQRLRTVQKSKNGIRSTKKADSCPAIVTGNSQRGTE